MPFMTKTYRPQDIFQAPVDIWIDIAAPPSARPAVPGVNTIAIDLATGAPIDSGTAGKHLGLTEAPASLSMGPTFTPIHADQLSAPVQSSLTTMDTEIGFTLKETNLANFPLLFAGLRTGTYYLLQAAGTYPASNLLQIGAMRCSSVQTHTLCLVGCRRSMPQCWLVIFAYKAYLKSAITLEIGRAKETVIKTTWGCLADVTRVANDQVLQINQTQPS